MGFNFPASPTIGQVYPSTPTVGIPQWVFDGTSWTLKGNATNPVVYVSDSPPVSPPDGALWFKSDVGMLYLYYRDPDGVQWVQAAASTADSAGILASAQSYSDRVALDDRDNLIINGGMEVSQEFGSTATSKTLGAWSYAVDMWNLFAAGNGTFAFQCIASALGNRGFRSTLRLYCGTAFNMATATDLVALAQPIEGLRWAKLCFGNANASPVTISFWVYATIAGTMSVGIRNGAGNRCYVTPVVINAAAAWEYKSVTIPGDVTGTWATDTTLGGNVFFSFGAGSGYQVAPNAWN